MQRLRFTACGAPHRRSGQSAGFTLVEVLVALAILAIALPSLMISISGQIAGFSHIRDKSTAHWVAMNKLTEMRVRNRYTEALPSNNQEGNATMLEREWHWSVETEKTNEDQMLQVTVNVRLDNDSDSPALATALTFFSLPPKP